MKKIDSYILLKLIKTFLLSIILLLAIIIVIDYSEHIDDFNETHAPLKEIAKYYLLLIPYFTNLFSALFSFITVLFVASKLGGNSEIIAMLSCGISFRRIMGPFMMFAFIVCFLSMILSLFIIPRTNALKLKSEAKYISTKKTRLIDNSQYYHSQIDKNTYIYIRNYDISSDVGYDFTLEKTDSTNRLISKISANFIKWNEKTKKWEVTVYQKRDFDKNYNENYIEGYKIDTALNILPSDFKKMEGEVETMDIFTLLKSIEKEKLSGNSTVVLYELEKHRRFASPFAAIILTLIGASLATRKVRGGLGKFFAIGLLLAFSYIMFLQMTSEFALKGGFDPMLAIWLPNIIYLFIGIFLFTKSQK